MMGNSLCFCCCRCRGGGWCGHGGARIHDGPPPTTLIIHSDGKIESLYCPVPAGELMAAYPGHVLCRAADLHAFTAHDEFAAPPPPQLPPEQELQLGDSYVLLPAFIFSISPEHSSETCVLSISQLIHPPPPRGAAAYHDHVHNKHMIIKDQMKQKKKNAEEQINHHVDYMHHQSTTANNNINHQQHFYPCNNDDDEENADHNNIVGNFESLARTRRAQAHFNWTPVLPTIQELTPSS